jgi:hypothetical protein
MFKDDDTAEITPPRFCSMYATDLTDIEEYLKHIYNRCQSSGFA